MASEGRGWMCASEGGGGDTRVMSSCCCTAVLKYAASCGTLCMLSLVIYCIYMCHTNMQACKWQVQAKNNNLGLGQYKHAHSVFHSHGTILWCRYWVFIKMLFYVEVRFPVMWKKCWLSFQPKLVCFYSISIIYHYRGIIGSFCLCRLFYCHVMYCCVVL